MSEYWAIALGEIQAYVILSHFAYTVFFLPIEGLWQPCLSLSKPVGTVFPTGSGDG